MATDTSPDVDELIRRISAVQQELSTLSKRETDRRAPLLAEEDELRQQLRGFRQKWEIGRSRQDLEAELAVYKVRYQEAKSQRIDLVKQMGGGGNAGPGADGWGAVQLNRQIDDATGIKEIEAHISRLEELLAAKK